MTELIAPRIMELRKKAMKEKDVAAKGALQALSAAFKQECVDNRIDVLSQESEMTILVKQIKQRKESIEMFRKADREDLASKEEAEMKFLEEFLPKQMTEDEVVQAVDKVIASMGGSVPKADMGKVMGKLSALKGKADMGKVSGIVRSKLV